MNDRDFKLLTRTYFQVKNSRDISVVDRYVIKQWEEQLDALESRILSELELFTKEDVQELPFKD